MERILASHRAAEACKRRGDDEGFMEHQVEAIGWLQTALHAAPDPQTEATIRANVIKMITDETSAE